MAIIGMGSATGCSPWSPVQTACAGIGQSGIDMDDSWSSLKPGDPGYYISQMIIIHMDIKWHCLEIIISVDHSRSVEALENHRYHRWISLRSDLQVHHAQCCPRQGQLHGAGHGDVPWTFFEGEFQELYMYKDIWCFRIASHGYIYIYI